MSFNFKVKSKKDILDPALLFQALGSPIRKSIIEYLALQEFDLAGLEQRLNVSYHAIYKHLQLLEEIGFITSYRIGVEKYYVLNLEAIQSLSRWLTMLSKQLQASNANYQYTYSRDNFGDTEDICSNCRKKDWHS